MGNNEIQMQNKSIVFIGFMGVGKTTIGKLVAKKLNWDFIDIDAEIEKKFNMPTTKIFEKFGEKTFRQHEREMIIRHSKQPKRIISVGGGAFLQEEIKKACMENCLVIYLDLSFELWKERINLIIDSRPVLQNKSLEEIKALFDSRKAAYSVHHLKIETDHLGTEEVVNHIVESSFLRRV